MCGRFAFKLSWRELYEALKFGRFPARFDEQLGFSYNIAPTHSAAIVYSEGTDRVLGLSRWGFVPAWWSQPEPPKHAINARSETAARSPLFRGAFKSGRCIIPASGFFEWQAQPDGSKAPFYIYRADGAPLLLAGLHDCRQGADSFAVLTTGAPAGMAPIHDRSPVIVEPENIGRWLDPASTAADVQSLCHPAADGVLAWHRVSKAIGNVRNNSPDLILPV
jgi:putative SOS response-associated peptidase YedK